MTVASEAPATGVRRVALTHHAVDQAQNKFVELAAVEWHVLRRLLTAAAGHAVPSPYVHVVNGQGFLDGVVWLRTCDVRLSFAYKMEGDMHLILTTLTRDEVAGNGGSRER